jgi:hypothetical protein
MPDIEVASDITIEQVSDFEVVITIEGVGRTKSMVIKAETPLTVSMFDPELADQPEKAS